MDIMDIIKARRSVRTFDGQPLSASDVEKLSSYAETISNPYDVPVDFVMLDAKEHGLSSPVIKGETFYVAAKSKKVPHSEEAFGFSFEKFVLYAWSVGVCTTWLAGTLDREIFDKAAGTKDDEFMYCVSPLGYPAETMSEIESKFRVGLHADERKPAQELFFDKNFSVPIAVSDEKIKTALEAVRLAPSATNQQPWRIVRDGNRFHFYEQHSKSLAGRDWDVQKIDMGIALCHFMEIAGRKLLIENPGIALPDDTEYISTVALG